MATLHIEHTVADFDTWKKMFDSDPAGRQKSGVRSYKVQRQVDDPNHVMIDMDFDSADTATAFLGKLRKVWQQPQVLASMGGGSPEAKVVDAVESKKL